MNSNFFIKNQEEFSSHPIVQSSIYHGQYDNQDSCWDPNKKSINSPVRHFILNFLLPFIQLSQRRDVFEIGCGTGWLLAEIKKYAPHIVIGIDPSIKNVNIANRLYPDIQIYCSNFENFKTNNKYSNIYSIMTLSHFLNLKDFFIKCANLMKANGKLIIVVPDFDYFQRPRPGICQN
ncbi:MAG: class I SAM-dependent methyltransferase [Bacteroidales bacterium]|nr:class I SAM-dependent methyltransferase [Bacteroidales bacterium]